ncbi:hypothetical protein [Lentilactobacillus senioris]|uniref:hypothetical protein n=1 Tax=Lentilactobacillus senioris TaxID=931534 RepID=UPI0020925E98|nr:hypothetical protein [Lentilactobacillus senioris]
MTYEVDNIKTIKPTTANPVQRDPQTNQVTLMTCTPLHDQHPSALSYWAPHS